MLYNNYYSRNSDLLIASGNYMQQDQVKWLACKYHQTS